MGPNLGLELVHSHESVAEIANLGLVFLLFMIGLLGDVFFLLIELLWFCGFSGLDTYYFIFITCLQMDLYMNCKLMDGICGP